MNKKEGFIGWGLKKDEAAEPLGECSDLDEVMAISRDGNLKINKVAEKEFFGADLLHAIIFQRGDTSTTYNVIYEHKESGVDLRQALPHGRRRHPRPALPDRRREDPLPVGVPDSGGGPESSSSRSRTARAFGSARSNSTSPLSR